MTRLLIATLFVAFACLAQPREKPVPARLAEITRASAKPVKLDTRRLRKGRGNVAVPLVKPAGAFERARRRQAIAESDGVDQRMLPRQQYEPEATSRWPAWWRRAIARERKTLQPVDLPFANARAIAEAVVPLSTAEATNEADELEAMWARGYRAVLVSWRGEPVPRTLRLVRSIADAGWRVVFAFGPHERAESTPYVNADKLRQVFGACLPYCDAILVHWRKTSGPHWANPGPYADVIAELARAANPEIAVIGEVYVRNRDYKLFSAIPACSSAVLVTNAAYRGVIPESVRDRVRTVTNLPLGALIVGPVSYYRTINAARVNMTDKQVLAWCQEQEGRFIDAGYAFTITLAGDGYGDREYKGQRRSDALTRTQWRNAK